MLLLSKLLGNGNKLVQLLHRRHRLLVGQTLLLHLNLPTQSFFYHPHLYRRHRRYPHHSILLLLLLLLKSTTFY